jgi:hypothetical protein
MRRLTSLLCGTALSLFLAGNASALSIIGDLSFFDPGSGSTPVSGEVLVLSVENDLLEVRVSFDQRTASDFGILVHDSMGNVKLPSSAGTSDNEDPMDDEGAQVKDIVFLDSGEVVFVFRKFPNTQPSLTEAVILGFGGELGKPGKGNPVGPLLEVGDEVWFRIFTGIAKGGGKGGSNINVSVHGTIVPEASTVALLGVGLLGLVVHARRRLRG